LFSYLRLFLFFSVSDLLLSTDRFFSFCFSFSVSGGRLYDQEGRRLLGFCRVWPAEMEKKSAGLIVGFSCLCCCHRRLLELRWRWERLLVVLRRRKGWSPLLVVAAAVGARCWLKEADGSAETGEGRRRCCTVGPREEGPLLAGEGDRGFVGAAAGEGLLLTG
jgi:hypothetical protein